MNVDPRIVRRLELLLDALIDDPTPTELSRIVREGLPTIQQDLLRELLDHIETVREEAQEIETILLYQDPKTGLDMEVEVEE